MRSWQDLLPCSHDRPIICPVRIRPCVIFADPPTACRAGKRCSLMTSEDDMQEPQRACAGAGQPRRPGFPRTESTAPDQRRMASVRSLSKASRSGTVQAGSASSESLANTVEAPQRSSPKNGRTNQRGYYYAQVYALRRALLHHCDSLAA